MLKIVEFPFCNLKSVKRFLEISDISYDTLSPNSLLPDKDIILIPGVGTFDEGMTYLRNNDLVDAIKLHVSSGGKLIGICLGMQLLMDSSEESPGVDGLGLINGTCQLIPPAKDFMVPHIGWNHTEFISASISTLYLDSTEFLSKPDYYFVHSYHVVPIDKSHLLATFSHPTGNLAAAINSQNIFGLQFHPEKSGPGGYHLLQLLIR
jgi:glutamine amidotransferase